MENTRNNNSVKPKIDEKQLKKYTDYKKYIHSTKRRCSDKHKYCLTLTYVNQWIRLGM